MAFQNWFLEVIYNVWNNVQIKQDVKTLLLKNVL